MATIPRTISTDEQELELTVTGMSCSHCSVAVQRSLESVSGVRAARVDLKTGKAKVFGKALDRWRLAQAVKDLGYEVAGE